MTLSAPDRAIASHWTKIIKATLDGRAQELCAVARMQDGEDDTAGRPWLFTDGYSIVRASDEVRRAIPALATVATDGATTQFAWRTRSVVVHPVDPEAQPKDAIRIDLRRIWRTFLSGGVLRRLALTRPIVEQVGADYRVLRAPGTGRVLVLRSRLALVGADYADLYELAYDQIAGLQGAVLASSHDYGEPLLLAMPLGRGSRRDEATERVFDWRLAEPEGRQREHLIVPPAQGIVAPKRLAPRAAGSAA